MLHAQRVHGLFSVQMAARSHTFTKQMLGCVTHVLYPGTVGMLVEQYLLGWSSKNIFVLLNYR